MADKMEFPKIMKEFIDSYSFKDEEKVYTNGSELMPVFRVEQALEHYEKEIRNKGIDDFLEEMEKWNSQIKFMRNENAFFTIENIREVAEQLKGEKQ